MSALKKYLFNCFLLTLPILIWDIVLTPMLPKAYQPEIFRNNIPAFISYGENISRTLVFILMLLMPLRVITPLQKKGFWLYIIGILLYSASWLPLIFFPQSVWSTNALGFFAPAYTPLVWLTGIGLLGDRFYFGLYFRRWFFISAAIIFLVFHNLHTYLIYCRVYA